MQHTVEKKKKGKKSCYQI